MSEQPVGGGPPAARAGSAGGGNVFTQKLGPLPMWAWVAIAAGILIVWRVYAGKQSQAAQQSTAATGTGADQVPYFINQVYTGTTPPSAPATGTTAPARASTGICDSGASSTT